MSQISGPDSTGPGIRPESGDYTAKARAEASPAAFVPHPVRGRFNASFFGALDSYINWLTRDKKRQAFSELPQAVVEVGPGVGANFGYLPPSCHLIAIEPNPHMHRGLRQRVRIGAAGLVI
jgi:hypothetical protein